MESPRHKFQRLATALDELIALESTTLDSGDHRDLADLQRRTGPLVSALAGLGQEVRDEAARARIASLLSRRQHNIELMESQLAIMQTEMRAVQASAGRVARIAPVYGQAGMVRAASTLRAAV